MTDLKLPSRRSLLETKRQSLKKTTTKKKQKKKPKKKTTLTNKKYSCMNVHLQSLLSTGFIFIFFVFFLHWLLGVSIGGMIDGRQGTRI
ncbi:hypothetical protein FKM82_017608 [Ascaphus truei]